MKNSLSPFTGARVVQSAPVILRSSFVIAIADYDRGAQVWDTNLVNAAGKVEPGWVHQPEVTRECVVVFSTNEGKGTGRQIIPADEFEAYVSELEAIIASDYAEPTSNDRTEYVPTNVVARQSFRLAHPTKTVVDSEGKKKMVPDLTAPRDVVSVRSKSGKGAKPMTVPMSEFPEVVALLRGVADNIETYKAQAWEAFQADGGPAVDPPTGDDGEDS